MDTLHCSYCLGTNVTLLVDPIQSILVFKLFYIAAPAIAPIQVSAGDNKELTLPDNHVSLYASTWPKQPKGIIHNLFFDFHSLFVKVHIRECGGDIPSKDHQSIQLNILPSTDSKRANTSAQSDGILFQFTFVLQSLPLVLDLT